MERLYEAVGISAALARYLDETLKLDKEPGNALVFSYKKKLH
jgi:hypothetical protein